MFENSKNLSKARKNKNDEFYTFFSDVEKELLHYKEHFKNKIVYCNCDNPKYSAFWEYFHLNFSELGLRKLVATYYDKNSPVYEIEYIGGDDNNISAYIKTLLKGNGDFRNKECLDLLDECDIVVTNPPFSLFREYVAILMEHNKKFLIIGNKNAITYKEFFPLLKDNKVWIGCNSVKEFLQPDGSIKKFGNISWFTNLDSQKRHKKLILQKHYTPEEYFKYDNYNAINVDKVSEIPYNYDGVMGVPITFLDKWNPEQFDILGYTGGLGWNDRNEIKTSKKYIDCKQHNPDGSISSGEKVNTGATLCFDNIPTRRYYTASNCNGYLLRIYGRILIRKKGI